MTWLEPVNWLDDLRHAKNRRSRISRSIYSGVLYIPADLRFEPTPMPEDGEEDWFRYFAEAMSKPIIDGPAIHNIICGIGGMV